MGNISNKTTKIIITKIIPVPDFSSVLNDSLSTIKQANCISADCEKRIKVNSENNIEMIKQYCLSVFTPFFNLNEEDKKLIFSRRIFKNYINHFQNCSHYVSINYIGIGFDIYFGLDREDALLIRLPLKQMESPSCTEYLNIQHVVEGWSDYKMLLKTALEEAISSKVKEAVDKAQNKVNELNSLTSFEV